MTTASNIFNQFASAKNFTSSGNRVTSRQPGRAFASTEAMNYIPVGYNTSGGNMFKYGSMRLLSRVIGGQTSSSELAENSLAKDLVSKGRRLQKQYRKSGGVLDPRDLEGQYRALLSDPKYHRLKSGNIGDRTPFGSKFDRNLNRKLSAISRRYEKTSNPQAAAATGNTTRRRVYAPRQVTPEQSNRASLYKQAIAADEARKAGKAAKQPPIKIPNVSHVGMSKLGQEGWNVLGKAIGPRARYAFAGAAGVAGVVAGGVTLGSILSSKNSPMGAGIAMGATAGALGLGAKYGASAFRRNLAASKTRVSKPLQSALRGMSRTPVGKIAALGAAVGLGVGVGRKLTNM